jgi:hypothetical protein
MSLGETVKALSISVMLSATDVHGKKCEQSVIAYDLSQQGARLDGINETLPPGSRVTLQYKDAIATAQIVWVVASGGTEVCQAGVRLIDPRNCPWRDALADPDNMLRLPDRRKSDRYKLSVGVQLRDEVQGVAMQTNTVDIGIGGFYVETLFPSPVGASLRVLLWLGSARLLANGVVRASCPGVGMGIEFLELSWEDTERLYRFLEASQTRVR